MPPLIEIGRGGEDGLAPSSATRPAHSIAARRPVAEIRAERFQAATVLACTARRETVRRLANDHSASRSSRRLRRLISAASFTVNHHTVSADAGRASHLSCFDVHEYRRSSCARELRMSISSFSSSVRTGEGATRNVRRVRFTASCTTPNPDKPSRLLCGFCSVTSKSCGCFGYDSSGGPRSRRRALRLRGIAHLDPRAARPWPQPGGSVHPEHHDDRNTNDPARRVAHSPRSKDARIGSYGRLSDRGSRRR